MTVTWVLEQNVFAEVCFDLMVEHFKANDIPYHIVKVIPFIHEIEGKVPEITGPCVVYGSIGVQKLAAKHGWTPGVFGGAEAMSEWNASVGLQELYLNFGMMPIPISAVGEHPDRIARLLGGRGEPVTEFFIKPDTDTKEFAGQVIRVEDFSKWYAGMVDSGYLDGNDFGVVVSRPQSLGCEWRVVVVDGKISSYSLYRQYQRVMPERIITPEVEAVVAAAQALYVPAAVYVIDVAQVDDDYKIIEYNTFNSAGLYACDPTKIIDDINAFLERTHA
jgi:hypothetical protein